MGLVDRDFGGAGGGERVGELLAVARAVADLLARKARIRPSVAACSWSGMTSNPALVAIVASRRCGTARAGTRPAPASRTGRTGQRLEGPRLPSRRASC